MSETTEILMEGSYLYFDKDVNYSQENFKLLLKVESQHHQYYSEILTRLETGEFLKVVVRYELNQHYYPIYSHVEKSIGNRFAAETYRIDVTNQELFYVFQNQDGTEEYNRQISSKHYLTTPAISTAAAFSLSKKFDATGRTAVTLLNSANDWSYQGPPTEKIIFAEFRTREMPDYKLNNVSLSASHLCLYEFDSSHAGQDRPVDIYVSKHFAIPYQLVQGDHKFNIKNLKKNA